MLPKTALKAIRAYCIECGDGTLQEVKMCPLTHCELYPWRNGRKPKRGPIGVGGALENPRKPKGDS